MNTPKAMRGLGDSNIYTPSNELPNRAPSPTTTWSDDLCPPSQRSEAEAFVAVRRFSRADRGTRRTSADCEAP
jgi:hypothetical protein